MPRRKTTIDRNPLEALSREPTRPRAARATSVEPGARRVVAAWTRSTDSVLQAIFEAQNAALAVGLSVFDASIDINRAVLADSADLWRQAQRTTRAFLPEESGQAEEDED
jgi:hypothetical protein